MDEMKKYIIEFSEDPHTIRLMKIKNGDKFPMTEFKAVKPYTEPDLDAIRKEAYQQGHKDGYNKHDTEKIRKRGYDKGLDDIGNALRLLLFQYSNYTLQTIFGYDTARAVVEHFEGSEIVAKIRCYEGSVKQDAETIRKEAYQRGYEDAKMECEANIQSNRDEAYNKGHNDGLKVGYENLKAVECERIDKAYKRGYDDAKHECTDCQKIMTNAEQERVDKAYQQGVNDAENRKATCEFCGYVNKGQLDEPCKFCANNYLNMFRPRKDNKLIRKNIKDIMDSLDCTISDFEKAIEEIKNEAD